MLLYTLIVSIFSVIFGLFTAGESALPITNCKRDSDDYSTCLKDFLQEAWPQFVKGFPEFDVPTLDPLFYKYGKIMVNTGEIPAEITAINVTAIGLTKARFLNVRTNLLDDVFRLEIDVIVPKVIIRGGTFYGTIGGFRIADTGLLKVIMDNARGTWDLTGHMINDTWFVEHFRVAPSLGKLTVTFEESLEGNNDLNKIAFAFINEYWPSIYRAMLPTISEAWDPWLTDFSNKIFSKLPFSKLFP